MDLRRRLTAIAVALFLVASAACTGDGAGDDPVPQTVPAEAPPGSPRQSSWSLDGVRVDRPPQDLTFARTDLPRSFPADDAALPSLLADPPGRAVLAYRPWEPFESGGWASERIFFLGADGAWRSLEMADLGLSESAWPGRDTYGAGELSYDGRRWAARTDFGVVVVELSSGRARAVATPGVHTSYLAWRPDGHQLDLVRRPEGKDYHRTWSLDLRTWKVRRAPYRLPPAPYAADASVVTFERDGGGTRRVIHSQDGTVSSEPVAVPYRRVRFGALVGPTHSVVGLYRSFVVVDNATMSPRARLGAPFSTTIALTWLDANRVLLTLHRVGLTAWNVTTGELQVLTRVRPALRPDRWWSATVALDLVR